MIKITRFLYVHFLILPLLVIAFLTKSQMTFFIAFGVVLIHELFHLFAALILNVKVYSVIIMPFGMTLRLDNKLLRSPEKEALIALAGPFSNVIMLILAHFFKGSSPNYFLFLVINYALLFLNLLPVPPLDGGRIARCLFIKSFGLMSGMKIMRSISKIFIFIIFSLGLLIFIAFHSNISLLMIGAFLLYNLTDEKRASDALIMRELIYEKEKLKKNSLIPCKTLCIHKNTPARRVLRKLNLSTFYIITIIDDDLKILRTVTESDFIKGVTSRGYGVTSEFIGI